MWNLVRCAVLFLAFALIPSPGNATLCLGKSDKQRIRQADCIFVGTAVSVGQPGESVGRDGYAVRFDVEQAWRGVNMPAITISSPNPFKCGIFFEFGSTYLVFASRGITDQSWGVFKLPSEHAELLIKKLGPPNFEVKRNCVERPNNAVHSGQSP